MSVYARGWAMQLPAHIHLPEPTSHNSGTALSSPIVIFFSTISESFAALHIFMWIMPNQLPLLFSFDSILPLDLIRFNFARLSVCENTQSNFFEHFHWKLMDQILAAHIVWETDRERYRECEQFTQIEIVTCRRRWNRNANYSWYCFRILSVDEARNGLANASCAAHQATIVAPRFFPQRASVPRARRNSFYEQKTSNQIKCRADGGSKRILKFRDGLLPISSKLACEVSCAVCELWEVKTKEAFSTQQCQRKQ